MISAQTVFSCELQISINFSNVGKQLHIPGIEVKISLSTILQLDPLFAVLKSFILIFVYKCY